MEWYEVDALKLGEKFGAHSGMAMGVARDLCPQATVIKGDSGIYTRYSHVVTEFIKSRVPHL